MLVELSHELPGQVITGIEWHRPQRALGQDVHLDALICQTGAEVSIGVGLNPHSRAIGSHEGCLVDAELDGPEVGGPKFGLVLRPWPGGRHVRRLVRPLFIPTGLGRALGPADGLLREAPPLRPPSPFDLVAFSAKEGLYAYRPCIEAFAGPGIVVA